MKHLLFVILTLFCLLQLAAQTDSVPQLQPDSLPQTAPAPAGPKMTPVDVDDNKPRVIMHYYDQHGDPLDEPVMFLATLDTVTKVKSKPLYPLYNGINVGVNFGDLIFMAFGQKHANFDAWANVSLFNWFFPTLECGLGYINDTPDKSNYTIKTAPSFYAKLGFNYNFLYKSNPDYQLFLGFRAGFSSFIYDINNVAIDDPYWDESQNLNLKGLRSTSLYGEVLAGIQVKIVSHFSLGWTARWHFKFKESSDRGNKPVFVPGYGTSSPFTFSVSAIWTIPSRKKVEAEPTPET